MAQNRRSKKRLGVQAKCSVLLSRLRPSAIVDTYFPNRHAQKRLQDLVCTKIEDATHGGRTTKSVFFSSPSIPNEELYCSKNSLLSLKKVLLSTFSAVKLILPMTEMILTKRALRLMGQCVVQGTGMRTWTLLGIRAWLSMMTMSQPL